MIFLAAIIKGPVYPSSFRCFGLPAPSIFRQLPLSGLPCVVMCGMFALRHQLQILNTIIKTIFIYMVNSFMLFERSAKMLFHNKTVFEYFCSIYANVSGVYTFMNPTRRWNVFFSLKLSRFFNSKPTDVVVDTCYAKDFGNFFLRFIFRNIKLDQSIFKRLVTCSINCISDLARCVSSFVGTRFAPRGAVPYGFPTINAMAVFTSHNLLSPLGKLISYILIQDLINSNQNLQIEAN